MAKLAKRETTAGEGRTIFLAVTNGDSILDSLKNVDIKALGAYKGEPATWKDATGKNIHKKVEMLAHLRRKHPLDFPAAQPGVADAQAAAAPLEPGSAQAHAQAQAGAPQPTPGPPPEHGARTYVRNGMPVDTV